MAITCSVANCTILAILTISGATVNCVAKELPVKAGESQFAVLYG